MRERESECAVYSTSLGTASGTATLATVSMWLLYHPSCIIISCLSARVLARSPNLSRGTYSCSQLLNSQLTISHLWGRSSQSRRGQGTPLHHKGFGGLVCCMFLAFLLLVLCIVLQSHSVLFVDNDDAGRLAVWIIWGVHKTALNRVQHK